MPTVLIDKRPDGVALLTLNRPERLNALWDEMNDLLRDLLEQCAADPAVRCVALTGAGRGFCAGGDIKQMTEHTAGRETGGAAASRSARMMDGDESAWQEGLSGGAMRLLYTMPKPTVALVNGPVAGGGLGLAFSCDLRLCSERATFVPGFRNIGLSGDAGVSFFMTKFIGPARTRELFFTGGALDAARAVELGLATRYYPHDELLPAGLQFCALLASGPTLAFGRMKANIALATSGTLEDVLRLEGVNQALGHQTQDHKAAALAFLERRPPAFTGQ